MGSIALPPFHHSSLALIDVFALGLWLHFPCRSNPLPAPRPLFRTNGLIKDTHHMVRCDKRGKGVGLLSTPDPLRFIFAFPRDSKETSPKSFFYYDLIIDPASISHPGLQFAVSHQPCSRWRSQAKREHLVFFSPFPLSLSSSDSPCFFDSSRDYPSK